MRALLSGNPEQLQRLFTAFIIVWAASAGPIGCITVVSPSDGDFAERITVSRTAQYEIYSNLDRPPGIERLDRSSERYTREDIKRILSYEPEGRLNHLRALISARQWRWSPARGGSIAGAPQAGMQTFRASSSGLNLEERIRRVFRTVSFSEKEEPEFRPGIDVFVKAYATRAVRPASSLQYLAALVSVFSLTIIPGPNWDVVQGYQVEVLGRSGNVLCKQSLAIDQMQFAWIFLLLYPPAAEFENPPSLLEPAPLTSVFAYLLEQCNIPPAGP